MYAIGIDLGTTYTAAAIWHDGRAAVAPMGSVPSVVLLEDDGSVVIGTDAERAACTRPDRVAREFKRRFGDEVPLLVAGQEVTSEELTAHLLRWTVGAAITGFGGGAPARIALTVPASWHDYRLARMRAVVNDAGLRLEELSLLPEPAAAAIYYAGREQVTPGSTVGVYDFGGGTFDATILRKTSGGFEMLGLPLGSDMIGGIDIDHALLGLVADALGDRWQKIDRTDPRTREGLAVLRTAAVAAKEALSSQLEVTVPVRLPCLTAEVVISRAALEDAIQPLVEQTVHLMLEVVEQAGLVARDLDRILLVGGSSRLPMVSRILTRELGVAVVADAHPKYAVCLGAAIASGSQLEPVESAASRPPIAASRPSTAPAEDVSLAVDLASRGLTEATHVPIRPAAELRRWRPAHPENEALVASIGTDESSRRDVRRALLIIGVLLALAAFTITVVLSLRH